MQAAFVENIPEAQIRDIFQYWLDRRPADGVPTRGSIDPRTIPSEYLPYLFLYQRDEQGRFVCKLMGTELVEAMGRDETGRYLDCKQDPTASDDCLSLFLHALETRCPVYFRHRAKAGNGLPRLFARIVLPLSSKGNVADQIFGMALFDTAMETRNAEGSFDVVIAATADLSAAVPDIA